MAKKNYRSNDPCVACKKEGEGMVCFHHLYTRKTYPEFEGLKWNQIPTCKKCHKIYHNKGTSHMANNHPDVLNWLLSRDWYYCTTVKKWRHDGI